MKGYCIVLGSLRAQKDEASLAPAIKPIKSNGMTVRRSRKNQVRMYLPKD